MICYKGYIMKGIKEESLKKACYLSYA